MRSPRGGIYFLHDYEGVKRRKSLFEWHPAEQVLVATYKKDFIFGGIVSTSALPPPKDTVPDELSVDVEHL